RGEVGLFAERGRAAVFRGLLEGVGDPNELTLRPRAPYEGDADREPEDVSPRHGDVRAARHRGYHRGAADEVIAVHQVDRPGWTLGAGEQGTQPVLLHDRIDPLFASDPAARRER